MIELSNVFLQHLGNPDKPIYNIDKVPKMGPIVFGTEFEPDYLGIILLLCLIIGAFFFIRFLKRKK